MKANEKLLNTTLDLIVENKKRWEQGSWRVPAEDPDKPSCGTAMCFAGWAVVADRGRYLVTEAKMAKLKHDTPGWYDAYSKLEYVIARKSEIDAGQAIEIDGKQVVSVLRRATNALGITEDQADVLFSSSNKLTDLRLLTKRLIAGKPIYG